MRTTVKLDDDVVAALQEFREKRKLGLSEAVNELIRAGLTVPKQRTYVDWPSFSMGPLKIDVTSTSAALEELDGPSWR